MRVDIDVDENTGEIEDSKTLKNAILSSSVASEDVSYIYVDLIIDDSLEAILETDGIGVSIDRLDSPKLIKLKITNVGATLDTGYLDVVDSSDSLVKNSNLPEICDDFYFVVVLNSTDNNFIIYSGYTFDLKLEESLNQNEYFLITMNKSNLYEEPLLGVGIIDYANSNIERSDVGKNIKDVLESDGHIVKQVNYDKDTEEIITQTQEA